MPHSDGMHTAFCEGLRAVYSASRAQGYKHLHQCTRRDVQAAGGQKKPVTINQAGSAVKPGGVFPAGRGPYSACEQAAHARMHEGIR